MSDTSQIEVLPPKRSQMVEAWEELQGAMAEHEKADLAASQAQKEATAAINRLNKAQAEFDKIVAGLKASAPRSSDWAHKRES